jgi:hypothetical protein
MENLKVNHVYLAKGLPMQNSSCYSLFGNTRVEKGKEIERIVVKEITDTCYLIAFEGSDRAYYVEKADTDVVYLEDLGVIAKNTK